METIYEFTAKSAHELDKMSLKECVFVPYFDKDKVKAFLIVIGNSTYRIYPEYGAHLIIEKS